jgi:hypothetical protein
VKSRLSANSEAAASGRRGDFAGAAFTRQRQFCYVFVANSILPLAEKFTARRNRRRPLGIASSFLVIL